MNKHGPSAILLGLFFSFVEELSHAPTPHSTLSNSHSVAHSTTVCQGRQFCPCKCGGHMNIHIADLSDLGLWQFISSCHRRWIIVLHLLDATQLNTALTQRSRSIMTHVRAGQPRTLWMPQVYPKSRDPSSFCWRTIQYRQLVSSMRAARQDRLYQSRPHTLCFPSALGTLRYLSLGSIPPICWACTHSLVCCRIRQSIFNLQ